MPETFRPARDSSELECERFTAALTARLIASPRHATLDRNFRQEYRPAMNTLLAILCVALLVNIAIGLVLQHILYGRLRIEHPKALEILDESSAGIMAFQRYLWKRQYLGLVDGSFTRRADSLRRYWKACFLIFLLVVVAVVISMST